ncbi:sigma-70 family RNA polymerase sigma factor [Klenkia terrae]|uniref:sigma-70 family RNA polymerase sigma factor n=1 Tax=Klenkia terrae TaxID=1052259 RepID=UPI001CD8450A|nr:sigma-70 family RNA polymerase sigma factor [Klenkia terrae]
MDLVATGASTGPAGRLVAVASAGARRRDSPAVADRQLHAVRGDLEQVFRRHYPAVVAVAARVLGGRAEAEDVAQEVFLSFGRSTVPAGEAGGWLSVAAAHTALNHLRSGRRRSDREVAVVSGEPTTVPDVVDDVLAREAHGQVRAALAALPRTQAVALVLRHSGLSYADVATALDLSPGSVGTTLRRAEAALRKELHQ